jgi:hypothetical protein
LFAAAKTAALEWLDACPDEMIRCCSSTSWQLIDAYGQNITVEAAAWVICKQKGHRRVSESAVQAFEASLKGKGKLA